MTTRIHHLAISPELVFLFFAVRTLALDIGNTAIKYGCFRDDVLEETAAGLTATQLRERLPQLHADAAIVSSVAAEPAAGWVRELQPYVAGKVVEFVPATTPLPIQNAYATPHTLGADRLAAAVGAAWLLPGRTLAVLDAGTAIKCDLVEGGHTFRGGSIAPGLAMRFRALHAFTGRLPLLHAPPEPTEAVPLTGTDTESAIRSGVLNGAAAEVQGLLDAYRRQFPQLAVVLAGGDAGFFRARLKGPIFVVPELVLIGLHRILVHHVST